MISVGIGFQMVVAGNDAPALMSRLRAPCKEKHGLTGVENDIKA
jgi:predicted small metal-binding protein